MEGSLLVHCFPIPPSFRFILFLHREREIYTVFLSPFKIEKRPTFLCVILSCVGVIVRLGFIRNGEKRELL